MNGTDQWRMVRALAGILTSRDQSARRRTRLSDQSHSRASNGRGDKKLSLKLLSVDVDISVLELIVLSLLAATCCVAAWSLQAENFPVLFAAISLFAAMTAMWRVA